MAASVLGIAPWIMNAMKFGDDALTLGYGMSQTKIGQAGLGAVGAAAGKGIYNVLTGNGPIQRRKNAAAGSAHAGCSCSEPKPKPTCEEKCAYGRMMAEKCQGCKGYTGKGPGGYKRRYGPGGYGSSSRPYASAGTSGYSSLPYGGSKPRVAGRQYRKTTRTTGRVARRAARQTRRTNRQSARQQRRFARRN